MAANEKSDRPDEPNHRNINRVTCRSRRTALHLESIGNSGIERVISASLYWTNEEKNKSFQKFKEIYQGAIHENLLIDGKLWSEVEEDEEEETKEVESIDEAKKVHLNQELLPQINEKVIRVSKSRKHCPHQCAYQFAQQCRHECFMLEKIQARPDLETPKPHPISPEFLQAMKESSLASARDVVASVEVIPSMLQQAQELEKGYEMLETGCQSRTDAEVFQPQASESKMDASLTPSKKRVRELLSNGPPTQPHPQPQQSARLKSGKRSRLTVNYKHLILTDSK